MDRASNTLLREFRATLASLGGRPGAPPASTLAKLGAWLDERVQPALDARSWDAALKAAHALEVEVAELPLPDTALSTDLRAEVLTAQVELLRLAAALQHAIEDNR